MAARSVPSAMTDFDAALAAELAEWRAEGLGRELRPAKAGPGMLGIFAGRELTNFASNDYLGLSRHPAVIDAAARACRDFGAGSCASRLLSGSLEVHHRLEESLAAWKNAEAALVFSSGFAAALGTTPALVGPGDFVVVDRLVHACCVDAARLSGATLRVFAHNDPDSLDRTLRRIRSRSAARVLIVTESVFSMDGDVAPLAAIVGVKDRHGAWLMLDEAHAVGLFGARLSGLAEALGLERRVEVRMGTLSKALGAAGGFIAGSRVLIDLLVNRARTAIFSTAPAPAASAAAISALAVTQSDDGRTRAQRAWANSRRIASALPPPLAPPASVIVPWVVGDEAASMRIASGLARRGVFAPAIRRPTVPRGAARIRFAATAEHTDADITRLAEAIEAAATDA